MSSPSSSGPDLSQIEVWEDPKSRSYDWTKNYTLIFHVGGSSNPLLIEMAVDAYIISAAIPLMYNLSGKHIEPLVTVEGQEDFCHWTATYQYAPTDLQWPTLGEDARLSFNTGGGTKHLTQSISTVLSTGGLNFDRYVNCTPSSVNGVDVSAPQGRFSYTKKKSWADVTGAYGKTLVEMSGTINSDTFKSYAAYEVLFLGASGTAPRDGADFTLTFDFAYSPTESNIQVGDLTIATKAGWDYLWHYDKQIRAFADINGHQIGYLRMEPVAAFVERVYKATAFSALGI